MGIFSFLRRELRPVMFSAALAFSACASQSQIKKGNHFMGRPVAVDVIKAKGQVLEGEIIGDPSGEIVDYVILHLQEGKELPPEISVLVVGSASGYGFHPPKRMVVKISTQDILEYIRLKLKGKYRGWDKKSRLRLFIQFLLIKATAHELERKGLIVRDPYR